MELEKFWILAESAWNDPNIKKAERAQTFTIMTDESTTFFVRQNFDRYGSKRVKSVMKSQL